MIVLGPTGAFIGTLIALLVLVEGLIQVCQGLKEWSDPRR